MIIDLEKNGQIGERDAEVCVVGAGAAGLTLAASLAKRGIRTLLLEAGGRRYSPRDQDLYAGEIGEGLAFNGLYDGRFRLLGGSTTQWAGQILELDDFIFEERSWVDGSGWPISKADLAPYYRKAAELEGLADAPSDAEKIWALLDTKPPAWGPDLIAAFSNFTLRTNFASLFDEAINGDQNLVVVLHANACGFVLDEDGTTILGVRCRTLEGDEKIFRARSFVLCMGGIETSRLLLQPSEDGGVAPWNREKMVGRHFQDHLLCYVADIVEENAKLPGAYLDFVAAQGYRFQHKLKLPLAVQRRLGTLDIGGFITHFTGGYDDMARAYETVRWIRTRRYEKLKPSRLVHLAANFHKLLWHKIPYSASIATSRASSGRSLKLNVNCEQNPLTDGRITLSSARDALGMFRAKVDWRASEQELHSIRKFVEIVREAFRERAVGLVSPVPSLDRAEGEFISTIRDSFHHLGGTRMAVSEQNGVVDPNLRLFGTRNGFVCSTSVFPSAGYANPTHTLLALALRLADHLEGVRASAPDIGEVAAE
ncbi:MAG: GMC family oxidoreductase [Bradyrhizobium sp.]|uniref:GMC oxidoreductase n=1 Tax=Bradyrhizobium sp. TaxID=376 RepID=UPI001D2CB937|nr:GMC family oxidoreductase [Bradyrhizobium sp.]MBV9561741.1 GMC family oxidoreductase [Bradyrhizobium sp.]